MEYGLWDIITQPAVLSRAWFTVWQSGVTVVIALAIGGGLAVLERHLRQISPRWFVALCSLIVFLPPLIISAGFIVTYGRVGAVNVLLQWLDVTPLQLLYTPATVVTAHSYYNVPLAFLMVRAALANIPQSFENTAAICGATTRRIITDIYWPQLRRPVVACAALIFLYCFTSFIVPLQLGGHQAQTLEVWLYQEIYLYHHYSVAGWLTVTQFAVLAGIVTLLLRMQPSGLSQVGGFNTVGSLPLGSGKLSVIVCIIAWRGLITVFLATPLACLVARALPELTWHNLTLLLHSQFIVGLGRSLVIALVAITITIMLVWILRLPTVSTLILVAISPVTLTFLWFLVLGKGYASLLAAFIVILLPIVGVLFQTVRARQPKFLTRTAQLLGATPWHVRLLEWRLTQPAVRRSVALGSIIVLGDATLSSLLGHAESPLVMPVIMNFISSYRFGLGSLSLVTLLLSFCVILMLTYAHDRQT